MPHPLLTHRFAAEPTGPRFLPMLLEPPVGKEGSRSIMKARCHGLERQQLYFEAYP